MRAIGAGRSGKLGVLGQKQRHAALLHARRNRLDLIDLRALVGVGQIHESRGHTRAERLGEKVRMPRKLLRNHEIQARRGAPRFTDLASKRHCRSVAPAIGRKGGICNRSAPTRR